MENPSLKDGFLKIGLTRDIEKRLKSASNTSLPDDYEILAYYEVKDMIKSEKRVFELLKEFRYKENKEFFTCSFLIANKKCIMAQSEINNLVNSKIGMKHYSPKAFDEIYQGVFSEQEDYVFEN